MSSIGINKASPTSFKLHFPILPETDSIEDQKKFSVHIISTILPSLTLNVATTPYRGTQVFSDAGIEFGSWTTEFYIDEYWESYFLFYDWITSISNGTTIFGSQDFSHQVDAILSILDNYENEVTSFKFKNIWPMELGETTLSYQDGEHQLSSSVTFAYDYFLRRMQ